MSYPGPKSPVPGGNPRAAFSEWLLLCDHITRAGGHILVLDPPKVPPDITEAAHLGALFPNPHGGGGAVYLLARPPASVPAQGQDQEMTGHVVFTKSERSPLASVAAEML